MQAQPLERTHRLGRGGRDVASDFKVMSRCRASNAERSSEFECVCQFIEPSAKGQRASRITSGASPKLALVHGYRQGQVGLVLRRPRSPCQPAESPPRANAAIRSRAHVAEMRESHAARQSFDGRSAGHSCRPGS